MPQRPPIVRDAEIPWHEGGRGRRFVTRRKRLGAAAGAERLGVSLYEIAAGAADWPFHYHLGNEEGVYVLAGTGRVRLMDGEHPIGPGDFVALRAGEDGAHRFTADAASPLRLLVVSTMIEPDVVVYPDSGKMGVFTGAAPGGPAHLRLVHGYWPLAAAVDYWQGEDTDEGG